MSGLAAPVDPPSLVCVTGANGYIACTPLAESKIRRRGPRSAR